MSLDLEIENLGASFDVLTDRVKARVAALAQDATDACNVDLDAAKAGPLAQAETEIQLLKATISDCDALNSRVMQLEGLYQITQAMRQAVGQLEQNRK